MVALSKPASRKNRDQIVDMIGDLRAFKINTMKAAWFPSSQAVPPGMLSAGHLEALRCAGGGNKPIYVVFSYGTPIAWRCAGDQGDDSGWCAPTVHYSVTTTKHQDLAAQGMRRWDSKLRRALSECVPPTTNA